MKGEPLLKISYTSVSLIQVLFRKFLSIKDRKILVGELILHF